MNTKVNSLNEKQRKTWEVILVETYNMNGIEASDVIDLINA